MWQIPSLMCHRRSSWGLSCSRKRLHQPTARPCMSRYQLQWYQGQSSQKPVRDEYTLVIRKGSLRSMIARGRSCSQMHDRREGCLYEVYYKHDSCWHLTLTNNQFLWCRTLREVPLQGCIGVDSSASTTIHVSLVVSLEKNKPVFQYADTQKSLGHSPMSTKIRHSRRPYVAIRRKKRLFGIRETHHQVPVVKSPVHSRYVKERIVRSTSRNCRLVKFNQSQRL